MTKHWDPPVKVHKAKTPEDESEHIPPDDEPIENEEPVEEVPKVETHAFIEEIPPGPEPEPIPVGFEWSGPHHQ